MKNMENSMICFVILGLTFPAFIYADTCLSPTVKSTTYTTSEAVVSTETILIAEFSLTCKNGLRDVNLYADIGGRLLPATKTAQPNKYQVSVSDEHKKLPAGSYEIRFFDEEGFAALRKAQRSGESSNSQKPLFTVSVGHSGIWSGPIVQSEFVAAMAAIIVWWMAYTARSKLLA